MKLDAKRSIIIIIGNRKNILLIAVSLLSSSAFSISSLSSFSLSPFSAGISSYLFLLIDDSLESYDIFVLFKEKKKKWLIKI